MPGIVGFVNRPLPQGAEQLLREMAGVLKSPGDQRVDLYHEHDMGLGKVSLGVIDSQPQPAWNAGKTICLLMDGELYDTQALKQDLLQRGYHFEIGNDPELILSLYQEYGVDFADKLNGAFVLAIWDCVSEKLLLINDRLGLFPLYYAQANGGLIFASGVRALLAD